MSGATKNSDGTKKKWEFGRTIVDGVPQFTSVSGLEKAERCLRQYIFHYKHQIKEDEEESESLIRGNAGHDGIETYLTTGRRDHLTSIVIQGMHQIPEPGPDLLIEYPFVQVDCAPDAPKDVLAKAARAALDGALLRAHGIPILGAMDLVHERPENVGVQDIRDAIDVPGVLKIRDWKFPGNMASPTVKEAADLPDTLQMAGYGLWGFLRFPHLERVRLEHAYFPQKGNPKVSSILVDRERVERTWKRADAIGVSILDAAREQDPNKVEANVHACRAFGRDCPAKVKGVCTALDNDPLSFLVGGTAADRLTAPYPELGEPADMSTTIAPNSLVAQLRAKRAAEAQAQATPAAAPQSGILSNLTAAPIAAPVPVAAAPAPAPAPAPVAAPAPAPAGPPPAVLAEMERLRALEAAAAAAPIAPPIAVVPAPTPELSLEQLIAEIEACGFGFPTLTGDIARAVITFAGGTPDADARVDGNGEYAPHVVTTLDGLKEVLADARGMVAQRTPEPAPAPAPMAAAGLMPPDAPPSNPSHASKAPVVPSTTPEEPKAPKKRKTKADKEAESALTTLPTAAAPAAAIVETPAPVEVAPAAAPIAAPNSATITTEPVQTAPSTGAINVYVDCVVEGVVTQSLWPVIDYITDEMSRDSNEPDFRMSTDESSKYAYGRWEGIMSAAIRQTKRITPGNWSLDGMMTKIGGVVVEALRKRVRDSGGVFVKGVR